MTRYEESYRIQETDGPGCLVEMGVRTMDFSGQNKKIVILSLAFIFISCEIDRYKRQNPYGQPQQGSTYEYLEGESDSQRDERSRRQSRDEPDPQRQQNPPVQQQQGREQSRVEATDPTTGKTYIKSSVDSAWRVLSRYGCDKNNIVEHMKEFGGLKPGKAPDTWYHFSIGILCKTRWPDDRIKMDRMKIELLPMCGTWVMTNYHDRPHQWIHVPLWRLCTL